MKATGIATTASRTEAIALASTIRPRWGTRAKVVRPVRWLHSLVTDRIAMIGSASVSGTLIAAVKVR